MKSELIPIVPSCGIYLQSFGHCNEQRFAAEFALAWEMIPLEDREVIVSKWKASAARFGNAIRMPKIEVLPHKSDWSRGPSGSAIAQFSRLMQSFSFSSQVVDALPSELLRILIVHELSHCYLDAVNPDHFGQLQGVSGEDLALAYTLAESENSDQLALWDIDDEPLERWISEEFPRLPKLEE